MRASESEEEEEEEEERGGKQREKVLNSIGIWTHDGIYDGESAAGGEILNGKGYEHAGAVFCGGVFGVSRG